MHGLLSQRVMSVSILAD